MMVKGFLYDDKQEVGLVVTCPICFKTAHGRNRRQNMENHMLTHTGLKPHQCTFCSYKSSQIGNLRRHIKTLHLKMIPNTINNTCSLPAQYLTSTVDITSTSIGLDHSVYVSSSQENSSNNLTNDTPQFSIN